MINYFDSSSDATFDIPICLFAFMYYKVSNGVEDLKSQCKLALKEYDPANEAVRARSRSLHHPFSFPKTSVLYQQPITLQDVSQRTELDWIPEYPTPLSSNLAPISAVARAVRARLHNSALEWVDVTNAVSESCLGRKK